MPVTGTKSYDGESAQCPRVGVKIDIKSEDLCIAKKKDQWDVGEMIHNACMDDEATSYDSSLVANDRIVVICCRVKGKGQDGIG